MINNQSGFTIVQAIFILVILSALGSAMVKVSELQNHSSATSYLQSQALFAARSGLEWAAAHVRTDEDWDCNYSYTLKDMNIKTLCGKTEVQDELTHQIYAIYTIQSRAVYGNFGDPDYVERSVYGEVISK